MKLPNVGPFEVKYEAGHSYQETWEHCDDLFCPNCGRGGTVWEESGDGNCDTGTKFLCRECRSEFHLPTGVSPDEGNWQNEQRLKAINDSVGAIQNPPNKKD